MRATGGSGVMRKVVGVLTVGALVGGLGVGSAGAAPDGQAAPRQAEGDDQYDVYTGRLDLREL
ncbi:MAG TPA: hypothetical protein VFZ77_23000, partial [Acidimicrobiales bacterium]